MSAMNLQSETWIRETRKHSTSHRTFCSTKFPVLYIVVQETQFTLGREQPNIIFHKKVYCVTYVVTYLLVVGMDVLFTINGITSYFTSLFIVI